MSNKSDVLSLHTLGELGGHARIHFDDRDLFRLLQNAHRQITRTRTDFQHRVGGFEGGLVDDALGHERVLEDMLAEFFRVKDGIFCRGARVLLRMCRARRSIRRLRLCGGDLVGNRSRHGGKQKEKLVEALHVKKRGAALGIEPRTSRIFEFRDSPKARIILLDHTAGKAKKSAGCASLNTCIIPVRKRAATRSVALVRRLTRHEPAWVFWSAAQRYVARLTIGETFELRADRTCDTLTQ